MEKTAAKHTARRWTLTFVSGTFALALALLFVLVLRSIAVQITSPPRAVQEPYPDTSTLELCEAAGGRWVERPTRPALVSEPTCQGPLGFEREREAQHERSQQTMLFVFAIGGAAAVALSLLVPAMKPVAPGLMLGGIAAFFVAGTQIWILAPGLGRLATIVVIFLVVLGVGLHALRERE